jgi:hypothetical protein
VDAVTRVRELEIGPRQAALPRRAVELLEREWLLVLLGATVVATNAVACRWWLSSDGWYSIVYGREIVRHGLPHHDTLTLLGSGRAWLDQQWLAHVALYAVAALGGPKLACLVTSFLFSAAFLAAVVHSRRRGASLFALLVVAVPAWLYATAVVQAEVFSRVFFLLLLVLLGAESRRRTHRVWLVFPLLCLWANVHGAVVLGAGLVGLLGLIELGRRRTLRGFALVVAPWPCLLATPYGLSTVDYYRVTIFSSSFHQYLGPWMPPVPFSIAGGPFFVLTLIATAIVARGHMRLTAFELAALGVTLLAALEARRSIAWFAVACVLFLPAALQRELVPRPLRVRARLPFAVAAVASAFALAAVAQAAIAPQSSYMPIYDTRAADFAASFARVHPAARIWANDPLGDWLVYQEPQLWGRIAYDARWEQLTPRQLVALHTFLYRLGPDWKSPLRGYSLVLLNRWHYKWLLGPLERDRRFRVVYRDESTVALERLPG